MAGTEAKNKKDWRPGSQMKRRLLRIVHINAGARNAVFVSTFVREIAWKFFLPFPPTVRICLGLSSIGFLFQIMSFLKHMIAYRLFYFSFIASPFLTRLSFFLWFNFHSHLISYGKVNECVVGVKLNGQNLYQFLLLRGLSITLMSRCEARSNYLRITSFRVY